MRIPSKHYRRAFGLFVPLVLLPLKYRSWVVSTLTVGLLGATPVFGVPVDSGNGLQFSQINLTFPGATQNLSSYGLVAVNIPSMTETTGFSTGYLNVFNPALGSNGWVVRNMPVDRTSGYPGISTMMDLSVAPGTPVSNLNLQADFSPNPKDNFMGAGPVTPFRFTLLPVDNNAQGSDMERPTPPGRSVDTGVINFRVNGQNLLNWQPGHPNIEQDANQCGPAAVANSLQWLKDTKSLNVPQPHAPGIRGNTVAGQLDQAMTREAHKIVTSANNFVKGKLKYIDDNNLSGGLVIKHKNRVVFGDLGNDVTVGRTTSRVDNNPNLSLADWMIQEVQAGEDVELRIGWDTPNDGGHYINLIGAGFILDVPWIAWVHDAHQGFNGNDTSINGGVSWFDGGIGWSPIVNDRIVVYIEGRFSAATIDYAVSESVPEPSSLTLLGVGIVGLLGYAWRRQKRTIE